MATPAAAQEAGAPQRVIRAGHESEITDAVRDLVAAAEPDCDLESIRVEATQFVASLTCGSVEHSLFVTSEAPAEVDARAGVVRSASHLWARLVPAPRDSAAPLQSAIEPFLEALPEDLFVAPVADGHLAPSGAPPMARRVAAGALALLFVALAFWSRRKRAPESAA